MADFPAASFFHVYVQVKVNLPGLLVTQLHNNTPSTVKSGCAAGEMGV
jgi:hypothetical protein